MRPSTRLLVAVARPRVASGLLAARAGRMPVAAPPARSYSDHRCLLGMARGGTGGAMKGGEGDPVLGLGKEGGMV
jgi:hypothetical protein